jgi:hypothetical protein
MSAREVVMSVMRTASTRRVSDHFEPEAMLDPQAQRRLRGQMERIDYTAFASNREVIGHMLGQADGAMFQRLAVAAAQARARWVAQALAMTEGMQPPEPEALAQLALLRTSFEELTAAYEGLRRMVERGYLGFGEG